MVLHANNMLRYRHIGISPILSLEPKVNPFSRFARLHSVTRGRRRIPFHRGGRRGRRDEAGVHGRAPLHSAISANSVVIDLLLSWYKPRTSEGVPVPDSTNPFVLVAVRIC